MCRYKKEERERKEKMKKNEQIDGTNRWFRLTGVEEQETPKKMQMKYNINI